MNNLAFFFFCFSVGIVFSQEKGTFTDTRDGKVYKTVVIGTQTWMAENLNVSTFRNGDTIPEVKNDEEWLKAGENKQPAWCYNINDKSKGMIYGKLYNWYAVNDLRGLAPEGWNVPTDEEWTLLTDYLGGEEVAGTKMKSSNGWIENRNVTNESGFSGLPGGSRDPDGAFFGVGYGGSWWSSTEIGTFNARSLDLGYDDGNVYRSFGTKHYGFSVRCLKD